MTKNQIEYAKLRELQRANRASERLTAERDEANRRLGLRTLEETARHNTQVELNARDNLAEQYRNNTAQLQELQRSHLASEGLSAVRADTERMSLEETKRHNLANEDVALRNAVISQYAADVSASSHLQSAQTSASAAQGAAAIAAAASQYASDNALLMKQLQLDLDKYGIDIKHNEAIAHQQEVNRSNRVREHQTGTQIGETARHNVAMEGLTSMRNIADMNLGNRNLTIAERNADTQRMTAEINKKKVEADIQLNPGRSFVNTTQGISNIANALRAGSTLIGNIKKGAK